MTAVTGFVKERLRKAMGDADAADQVSAILDSANTGVGQVAVLSSGCDATHFGIFGITAVVRTGAFTQTYVTASHTHAAVTYVALTDLTGGVAATTFAAITAPAANATTSLTADMTAVKNALAQVVVSFAAMAADVANVKQVLNALVDDLQLYGISQ